MLHVRRVAVIRPWPMPLADCLSFRALSRDVARGKREEQFRVSLYISINTRGKRLIARLKNQSALEFTRVIKGC